MLKNIIIFDIQGQYKVLHILIKFMNSSICSPINVDMRGGGIGDIQTATLPRHKKMYYDTLTLHKIQQKNNTVCTIAAYCDGSLGIKPFYLI